MSGLRGAHHGLPGTTITPNPQERHGVIGFELLRDLFASQPLSKLLGAFRGQARTPQYRFASGHGSFSGPYYGIDQASARLSFEQFRMALIELMLDLPDGEAEAIFATIAGGLDGTLSLSELIRELRADPCDRTGRWGRRRVGQIWAPARDANPSVNVRPTQRSAYTAEGGWRKAPTLQKENVTQPPPPPPPPYRVAPPDRTQYNSGANVLSSQVKLGPNAETGYRKPPPPPKVSTAARGRWTHSGRGPQLHASGNDTDCWKDNEKIGQHRRPAPSLPSHIRVVPSASGFTHGSSFRLGSEVPEPPPPPPPPPAAPVILQSQPWVSGYNRSGRDSIQARKEAWAEAEWRAPPPAPPPKSEFKVAPGHLSGWVANECSLGVQEPAAGNALGKCAFCRMEG